MSTPASNLSQLKVPKWVWLILLVLALILLYWLVSRIPPVTPNIVQARQSACESNLKQLWLLLGVNSDKAGEGKKVLPKETGKAFWLSLTKTNPPVLTRDHYEVLICPSLIESTSLGTTSYYGPLTDANKLENSDIIGCCADGNHPDGIIILRKNGDIVLLKGDEAKAALQHVTR
jgi:hypothetical protein